MYPRATTTKKSGKGQWGVYLVDQICLLPFIQNDTQTPILAKRNISVYICHLTFVIFLWYSQQSLIQAGTTMVKQAAEFYYNNI